MHKETQELALGLEEIDSLRNISLLLVDDEPQILDFLKWSLKEIVSDIHLAASGEDAIQLASKTHIDVAIVDLCLPGIDGISLIYELKKINPQMLVAVLTGQGEEGSLRAAVKAGAYDFLDKPIDSDSVRLAVARYSDRFKSDQYLNQILRELFLATSGCVPDHFDSLSNVEKTKHLKALLGFLRLKLMRKEFRE